MFSKNVCTWEVATLSYILPFFESWAALSAEIINSVFLAHLYIWLFVLYDKQYLILNLKSNMKLYAEKKVKGSDQKWSINLSDAGPTLSHKVDFNHLTAKLFNLNFYPLEVMSRWRDPQLQVSENYSDLTEGRSTLFKYRWLMSNFILTCLKGGTGT